MELVDRILEKCTRSGAEMAEVYLVSKKNLEIVVRDGKVETIKKATPAGLAIRYFSFGKTAFAHTNDISDQAVDKLIFQLSKIVKKTGEDKYAALPSAQSYKDDLDLYDLSEVEQSTDSKIEYLIDLEQRALQYDPIITRSNGMTYEETVATKSLVNSNGVSMSYETTLYNIVISVSASKKGEMFPGEGEFAVRHFADLPAPEDMVKRVASRAVRLVAGGAVDAGDYEIIFTPDVSWSLLWGLSYAVDGDSYLKNSSFLAGKENARVAVGDFSLYDDATMPRGVASRPADDEGSASRKIALVENGVFKQALYDTKTAVRAGAKSTGSSVRNGYATFPGIAPSNFFIAPGKDNTDAIISSCRKGIMVEGTQGWGLHSVTGQYSAGINGVLIRNGKMIRPVANVTVAASGDELLNGIGAICDDITFYSRFNAPTIMIKKMKVGA